MAHTRVNIKFIYINPEFTIHCLSINSNKIHTSNCKFIVPWSKFFIITSNNLQKKKINSKIMRKTGVDIDYV